MNYYQIKAGTTDVSVVIRIIDSADGTPETGVVYNTSGIALEYRRELAASTAITEATLAALTTAHADGGFLHIGNGYYRLDLPDAAVASGAAGVLVHGTVTGMVVIGCYIQLVAYDPFDTVRLGLTALPNAAAEASGGLYTRGTGAGQINQANNGQIDANAARTGGTTNTGRDIGASVLLSSGTGTGQLSLSSGLVTLAGVTHTGAVIPTVTTLTGHTAQTGDAYARLGAPAGASVSADVAAVKTDTGNLVTRITSTLFAGITSLAEWLGLMAGKQTGNTTARTELRATGAGSGTYSETTDSLEAVRDRGDAAWITATGFSTLDAAGVRSAVGLASANLDTQIGALATASNLATVAGYLDTEIAAILADTNELQTDWANGGRLDLILDARASQTSVDDLPTNAELATSQAAADDATLAAIAALTIPSAATIADAVWDEALAGHATGGSAGAALSAATAPSAADVADAVWDEALSGHVVSGSTGEALGAAGGAGDPWITSLPGAYSSGQAGYILGTNLNATVSSRASQTSVDTVDDLLDTEVAAIYSRLGAPAGASMSADIAAVKAQAAAIETDTQDLQSRTPAALVSGRMDASVGAMAANVMTAAAAAADLTTELQSGLATAAAVATLQTSVDDVPTNAELATALGTADDAVLARLGTPAGASVSADIAAAKADTAAIKVKTDSLTFTSAGKVDANIRAVNSVAVDGTGALGDEWGPV